MPKSFRVFRSCFVAALLAAVSGCARAIAPTSAVHPGAFAPDNPKLASLAATLKSVANAEAAKDAVRHFVCRGIEFQIVVAPRMSSGYRQFVDSFTVSDTEIPVDLTFIGCDESIDTADLAVVSEVKSYFGSDMETTVRDFIWIEQKWVNADDRYSQLLEKNAAEAARFKATMRKVNEMSTTQP